VDNFGPVDNVWIVKNLGSYPQVMHSGGNATQKSYPQLIHRVMHIAACGAKTTEGKTRLTKRV
jgi:hypothetical protein